MDRSQVRNEDQSSVDMDLEFLDVERGGDGTRSTISAHQAAQLALPASGVTVSANRRDFNETGLFVSSHGLHDTCYVPDDRQVAKQFHELLLHDKPNALEKHRQQIAGQSKPTSSKYSTPGVKSQVHEEFGDLLLEDFEDPLNKSALTKSSSITSEFEIVEDTDAEILTLQEDDFEENYTASEPLSHQLLQIADLLKSAAVTARGLHAPSVKHQEPHLPEGTRSTNSESSEVLHTGCRQQIAALEESLNAECESKLAALRLQISEMSPAAPCKNCRLTETRLQEKCCRLERQLRIVSCDFQSANKKNKEYEDEISLLKDDRRKLRTLIQQLERNAPDNMTWPSSAEHSVVPAAMAAERTVDITKPMSASSMGKASLLSTSNETAVWSCPRCTFDNLRERNFCEMCGVSR